NDFRYFPTLKLDDQAHAVLIGLVADVGDTFNTLLVDQFGDFLLQGLLVDLIRKRVNDDCLTIASINIFKVSRGAHDDSAAARTVTFAYPGHAVNNAARGEVRRRDHFHQFVDG